MKNYASAEQIIIFRAGEVSIRHFIGMPLILAERKLDHSYNREGYRQQWKVGDYISSNT